MTFVVCFHVVLNSHSNPTLSFWVLYLHYLRAQWDITIVVFILGAHQCRSSEFKATIMF